MQLLIDLTTINHSSFFREETSLQILAEHLVGLIRHRSAAEGPVRVWSAGCSAGQEPYSLAMIMAELSLSLSRQVLDLRASDISLGIIRGAARAIYEARDVDEIAPERLRRYFLRGRGGRLGSYRIAPEIRHLLTFHHFDLRAEEWPIPKDFDAILCRNVAIYFAEPDRIVLLDRLASHLKPAGWLVVGNAEILPERPGLLRKVGPSTFERVASS